MKRLILLLTLALSLNVIEAKAQVTDPIVQIEERITMHLKNYLEPDEFMVIVTPQPEKEQAAKKDAKVDLPGVPGFDSTNTAASGVYSFDPAGDLQNQVKRPPLYIQVILAKTVGGEKRRLLERMLPNLARLDREYGDKLQVSSGQLIKIPRPSNEPQPKSWVDELMKYKNEFVSLGLGLFAALASLLFINGLLAYFSGRRSSPQMGLDAGGGALPQNQKPRSDEASAPSQKPTGPPREALYSKDAAILGIIKELSSVANDHPERAAALITLWIQKGESGATHAASLINNFDIRTTEKILAHMVPSDLDRLRGLAQIKFDPFSDENVRVLAMAREEIMKVTAQSQRASANKELQFLAILDDDVLKDVLKDEDVKTLAFVCSQVPAHRMIPTLEDLSEQDEKSFFMELTTLDRLSHPERKVIVHRLKEKTDELSTMAFSSRDKVKTLTHILKNISAPSRQKRIMERIELIAPEIKHNIRSQIVLFEDLLHLPDNLMKMILVEDDPMFVAHAFIRELTDIKMRVRNLLPRASAEIFDIEVAKIGLVAEDQIEEAQHRLLNVLQKFIDDGVVDRHRVMRRDATGGNAPNQRVRLVSGG